MINITIAFVGDSGVGKTSFIKRHLDGTFSEEHFPTSGYTESTLNFNTNVGGVQVNVLDFEGDVKFLGQIEQEVHGAIVMFDEQSTQESALRWIDDIESIIGDIPIVACLNKIDAMDSEQVSKNCEFYFDLNQKVYPVSAKSGFNLEKPFLYLMQSIIRRRSITMIPIQLLTA